MIDEQNLTEALDTQEESNEEETAQEETQESPQEKVVDRNWKQLREEKARLERERDEAFQLLQQLKNQKQAPVEEEIDPDDYVNAKYVNKKLHKQQQENMAVMAELRLRTEHPDIDKVLTADNIKLLSETDPHLATLLNSAPDFYTKAKAAYRFIKDRGIFQEEKNTKEKELINANKAKPRSSASVAPTQGDSPLGRAQTFADGLSKEMKAALLKEMTEARQNYS